MIKGIYLNYKGIADEIEMNITNEEKSSLSALKSNQEKFNEMLYKVFKRFIKNKGKVISLTYFSHYLKKNNMTLFIIGFTDLVKNSPKYNKFSNNLTKRLNLSESFYGDILVIKINNQVEKLELENVSNITLCEFNNVYKINFSDQKSNDEDDEDDVEAGDEDLEDDDDIDDNLYDDDEEDDLELDYNNDNEEDEELASDENNEEFDNDKFYKINYIVNNELTEEEYEY